MSVFIYVCSVCGVVIEGRPGENFGAFNERVYDTHTVHHDADQVGLPVNVLRRRPDLAFAGPSPPLAGGGVLDNLAHNAVFLLRLLSRDGAAGRPGRGWGNV